LKLSFRRVPPEREGSRVSGGERKRYRWVALHSIFILLFNAYIIAKEKYEKGLHNVPT
jgi:hypothetical protein